MGGEFNVKLQFETANANDDLFLLAVYFFRD